MNKKYLLIAIVTIIIIAVIGIFAFSGGNSTPVSENTNIVDANALTE